jgi:hypothetical protein
MDFLIFNKRIDCMAKIGINIATGSLQKEEIIRKLSYELTNTENELKAKENELKVKEKKLEFYQKLSEEQATEIQILDISVRILMGTDDK